MPLNLFYTMVHKSQKWPKTQIKGGVLPQTSTCFMDKKNWIFRKMTKTRKLTFRLSPRHSLTTTTSAAGQVRNRHLMAHSKLIAGK